MEEVFTSIVKAAPEVAPLGVLIWLVIAFMRHLKHRDAEFRSTIEAVIKASDERFALLSMEQRALQEKTNEIARESTKTIAGNTELLRTIKRNGSHRIGGG